MTGRAPGDRPYTLIDFFPDDFLVLMDESHVTVPQVRGMMAVIGGIYSFEKLGNISTLHNS